MNVGDLVRYRGWQKLYNTPPLALVVDTRHTDSDYHCRIRVMWVGDKIPIQAQVLAVGPPKRISTWISPKHFELIGSSSDAGLS
jgi:hypothetical protein